MRILTEKPTAEAAVIDALLRPEPKIEESPNGAAGLGFLGFCLAAFALLAIYASKPIDAPEWPDCPIQALGSCGER